MLSCPSGNLSGQKRSEPAPSGGGGGSSGWDRLRAHKHEPLPCDAHTKPARAQSDVWQHVRILTQKGKQLLGAEAVGENTHVCIYPVSVEVEGIEGLTGQCRALLRCGKPDKPKHDNHGHPVYSTTAALNHLSKVHPDTKAVKQQQVRSQSSKKQRRENQMAYNAVTLGSLVSQADRADCAERASGPAGGGGGGGVQSSMSQFVKTLTSEEKARNVLSEL